MGYDAVTALARRARTGLRTFVLAAALTVPGVVAAEAPEKPPEGRLVGSFAVAARPVHVLDANPGFLGKAPDDLTASDVAGLDVQSVGRVGAVADGASQLLLRVRVAPGGRLRCEVIGGEANGSCAPLAMRPSPPVQGTTVAAAIYVPPDRFGPGAGPRLPKDRGEVETREVGLRLTYTGRGGAPVESTRHLLLARPPLVLVHGTFDSAALWWKGGPGGSFLDAVQAAGFRAFAVEYGGDGGGFFRPGVANTNQASFMTNRRVVWANPGGIHEALQHFRDNLKLAATRADVVGHSLGGLLPRIYASPHYEDIDHPYRRDDNFGLGDINRLVTLCTPHHGSVLPAVLRVFAESQAFRAGIVATVLGRLTLGLQGYWNGLDTEGAVRDQMPESPALKRIGATPIPGAPPIPAFAIGCIADIEDAVADPEGEYANRIKDLAWLFYVAPGLLEQYLGESGMKREAERVGEILEAFLARFVTGLDEARVGWLNRPEGAPDPRPYFTKELQELFRTLLFQYHENDFTVGLQSQLGSLGAANRSTIHGVLHSAAPRYRAVQERAIAVLKGEAAASGLRFAEDGFPPAGAPVGPASPSPEQVALIEGEGGASPPGGDGTPPGGSPPPSGGDGTPPPPWLELAERRADLVEQRDNLRRGLEALQERHADAQTLATVQSTLSRVEAEIEELDHEMALVIAEQRLEQAYQVARSIRSQASFEELLRLADEVMHAAQELKTRMQRQQAELSGDLGGLDVSIRLQGRIRDLERRAADALSKLLAAQVNENDPNAPPGLHGLTAPFAVTGPGGPGAVPPNVNALTEAIRLQVMQRSDRSPYKSWTTSKDVAIHNYGGNMLAVADIPYDDFRQMVADRRAVRNATIRQHVDERYHQDYEILIHSVPQGIWRVHDGSPELLAVDDRTDWDSGFLPDLRVHTHPQTGQRYVRVYRNLHPTDVPRDVLFSRYQRREGQ